MRKQVGASDHTSTYVELAAGVQGVGEVVVAKGSLQLSAQLGGAQLAVVGQEDGLMDGKHRRGVDAAGHLWGEKKGSEDQHRTHTKNAARCVSTLSYRVDVVLEHSAPLGSTLRGVCKALGHLFQAAGGHGVDGVHHRGGAVGVGVGGLECQVDKDGVVQARGVGIGRSNADRGVWGLLQQRCFAAVCILGKKKKEKQHNKQEQYQ